MNIVCNKQLLTEAVANVSRAVSSKNTMAALEGILLKAHGGRLELTGYDLELAISTGIDAAIVEEGDIILTARIFLDIIRKMPSETVTIQSDEKMLTQILGSHTQYTILGIPASDFPELPAVSQSSLLTLPKDTLKNMIGQTLFAVSTSDAKPAHMGDLFERVEGTLNVVAVDGYRLALRQEKIGEAEADEENEKMRFIVPGKSLQEVSKLNRDGDGTIQMSVSRRHIIFDIDGYRIISRLLEGDFLDYRAAIPEGGRTQVRISTRELISAIERTSLLISDNVKSPLRMRFCEDAIHISCSTALGKALDEISSSQEGEEVEIGFNGKYMLDALKASECDELRLILNGPLSPMKIMPLEGDSFIFLVLPVRLKSE